jgi:hypothetical protein
VVVGGGGWWVVVVGSPPLCPPPTSNKKTHPLTHRLTHRLTHTHTHSAFIKCGFAGESAPRCILPSPLDGWLVQAQAQAAGVGEGEQQLRQQLAGKGRKCWGVAEWEEVLGPFIVRLYLYHLRCRPKVRMDNGARPVDS